MHQTPERQNRKRKCPDAPVRVRGAVPASDNLQPKCLFGGNPNSEHHTPRKPTKTGAQTRVSCKSSLFGGLFGNHGRGPDNGGDGPGNGGGAYSSPIVG